MIRSFGENDEMLIKRSPNLTRFHYSPALQVQTPTHSVCVTHPSSRTLKTWRVFPDLLTVPLLNLCVLRPLSVGIMGTSYLLEGWYERARSLLYLVPLALPPHLSVLARIEMLIFFAKNLNLGNLISSSLSFDLHVHRLYFFDHCQNKILSL